MFTILGVSFLKISIICAIIISAVYLYMQHAFSYWKKRGVPYFEPTFPFGNIAESFKATRTFGETLADWYKVMKARGHKHMGMYFFTKPFYIPLCPALIKQILVKDFKYFHDRGMYCNERDDPLSAHLFSLDGEKWKNLRAKLSPTFTTGKLKQMFQTLVDCSNELSTCLNEPISKAEPVDIKQILVQYTTDVIGSCAFGIECNSFKQPNTEFIRLGRRVFTPSTTDRLKLFLVLLYPGAGKLFRIRVTNKDVDAFFRALVKDTIEYRENNHILRNDFLQLLIELKNKGQLEEEQPIDAKSAIGTTLTINETASQAFLFFIAGFETSSTTMNFCLYELARNQPIQDKLREEIITVLKKHEGKITYDAIMQMHYMERVTSETLRMYSPVMFLRRTCTNEYTIPETSITLEKNCVVVIPIHGLHRDPEFYPDPEVFDPNRFNEENKTNRPDYTYLPFGDGPRNCIGLRFGLMQVKVGLCQLIKNYKFSINPKTVEPMTFHPKTFMTSPKHTIWLNATKVTE